MLEYSDIAETGKIRRRWHMPCFLPRVRPQSAPSVNRREPTPLSIELMPPLGPSSVLAAAFILGFSDRNFDRKFARRRSMFAECVRRVFACLRAARANPSAPSHLQGGNASWRQRPPHQTNHPHADIFV